MIKHIVCLGGGVGTVQVIKGIRPYTKDITVVVSMADDGGSAGRLRRLYSVPPPGDLINCLEALSDAQPTLKKLLTYRFEGDRWGRIDSIGGHKIGNLILVALTKIMGDFNLALEETERLFSCHGQILPSTYENVSIWAQTTRGEKVVGEETIDLGRYKDALCQVHLTPENARTPEKVIQSMKTTDMIIVGPGDLYTTILPVLLVPDIIKTFQTSEAKKVFILNIANKRETENYTMKDHVDAIVRHCPGIKFDYLLVNNNQTPQFVSELHYSYIPPTPLPDPKYGTIRKLDLVDVNFPVQHDPKKLGKAVSSLEK